VPSFPEHQTPLPSAMREQHHNIRNSPRPKICEGSGGLPEKDANLL
jgi:hypothetical protein